VRYYRNVTKPNVCKTHQQLQILPVKVVSLEIIINLKTRTTAGETLEKKKEILTTTATLAYWNETLKWVNIKNKNKCIIYLYMSPADRFDVFGL